MKRKFKLLIKSSIGFSLTEVLIAIVILGVAGATIINGMTTDTKVRGKTNTATNVSVSLNAAAEVILATNVDLIPCASSSFTPPNSDGTTYPIAYKDAINSISGVSVVSVEALTRDAQPSWINCAKSNTLVASAAQRITLESVSAGTTMQKVILKTNASNSSTVATPFTITASKSQVTIAAVGDSSCGSWETLNLSNSLGSNSIVYSAVSNNANTESLASGSTVTLNGKLAGPSSVTIVGVNVPSGVTSKPITVDVTVLDPINFTTPNVQISVVKPNGRVISGSLTVSGGSNSIKTISSQTLSIAGNRYTFDASEIALPNSYANAISITDPGLPNAVACTNPMWKVPIVVQPKLAFTLNTSSRCIVGSSLSCSIPVIISPGTGSGQSVLSAPGNTYIPPNLSLSSISCGPAVTSFKSSSPLSNINPSKIQVILKASTFFTQFDPLNAKSVNLYLTKNGVNFSINNWKIDSMVTSGSGGNSLTTLVLSSTSSTIDVTGTTPTKIEIAVLNSIYPQLTDSNFFNNYTSPSSTLLDQYCN